MDIKMKDRHGNTVTGATGAAVDYFDASVEAFGIYRGDPVASLDAAIAEAPEFVAAHLAKAMLLGLTTEPAWREAATTVLAGTNGMAMNAREASLADAVGLLLDGQWSAAALRLDRHSMSYPHDFLAIQSGTLIDFFRANARDLRDRIARALPAWSPDMPLYSLLLGMHAFGLEECGDYVRAEETGRRALDLDRRDCWAHHAVAHVMEMQGRPEDGIGWMIAREAHWASEDNFFRVHNWWHRALFHLALEQTGAALALYDEQVGAALDGMAVNLVDASALLWRLHLCGADPGGRWQPVAEQWEAVADGALYPFNDWHAVMADLGAGRHDVLAARIARMKTAASGAGETAEWIRTIGLPLVNGFVAFWRGDYRAAAETLHAARFISNAFGGSHAQRDVIDWTLGEAALRAGMHDLATALAHERLALKPFNPLNHELLRRARG
jgi:hypothetical protein